MSLHMVPRYLLTELQRTEHQDSRNSSHLFLLRLLWLDYFDSDYAFSFLPRINDEDSPNRKFKREMIKKYANGQPLVVLAIVFSSVFVHRPTLNRSIYAYKTFKKNRWYFPLLVRFHYSRKCRPKSSDSKEDNSQGCHCGSFQHGKPSDYRLKNFIGFCDKFKHQIIVDGVSYRYFFVKAMRDYLTKYKKKSICSSKKLVTSKNWNRSVIKCCGFINDKTIVNSMFIRSFIVAEAKKSGCGPTNTKFKHFPHLDNCINECVCDYHYKVMPISMVIYLPYLRSENKN